MRERNFFHRSSALSVRKSPLVSNLASVDVDAVMAALGCDRLRAQLGYLVPDQYTNVMVVSSHEQTQQRHRGQRAGAHTALPAGT